MPYYTVDVYDNDLVRIDINDEFIKDMSWLFKKSPKDKDTFVKLMRKHEGESVHDVNVHIGSIQVHDSDLKETVTEYLEDNEDLLKSIQPIVMTAPLKKTTIEKLNDIIYRLDGIVYQEKAQLDKKELLEIREFLKDMVSDG